MSESEKNENGMKMPPLTSSVLDDAEKKAKEPIKANISKEPVGMMPPLSDLNGLVPHEDPEEKEEQEQQEPEKNESEQAQVQEDTSKKQVSLDKLSYGDVIKKPKNKRSLLSSSGSLDDLYPKKKKIGLRPNEEKVAKKAKRSEREEYYKSIFISTDENGEEEDPTYDELNTTEDFYDMDRAIDLGVEMGASDVILKSDMPPAYIVGDETVWVDGLKPVTQAELDSTLDKLIYKSAMRHFTSNLDGDTSYSLETGVNQGLKTRVNLAYTNNNQVVVSMRIVNNRIPTFDEIDVEPEIRKWMHYPSGMILVNGPTGSGKSTLLASFLYAIGKNYPKNIITIEEPIEYTYPNDPSEVKGIFTQREVGNGTKSYANGLKAALRQNPRVIMVGEIRDITEMSVFMTAANTGHLAVSTIHSNSAADTLDRILTMFHSQNGDLETNLSILANNVRGFVNQALVKKVDKSGRVAVREILGFEKREVRDIVKEGNVIKLADYMVEHGLAMEQKLAEGVAEGKLDPSDAFDHVNNYETFYERYKELTGKDFDITDYRTEIEY